MKKWKLALASLLLPTMALAQAEAQKEQPQQEQLQPQQMPQMQPSVPQLGPLGFSAPGMDAAQRGIVQGIVTNLDYGRGLVTVRSGRQVFLIRAKPQQLALYKPGELTTIHYAQYLGVPWMIESRSASLYSPLNFAQLATVVGVVTGVNKATGVVSLSQGAEPKFFQGHPEDVEALLPGQFVALTYARIGGENWINTIAPASETPVTGQ